MKVGLLIQNNLWYCPYVHIYTNLLKEWGTEYDLIFWDRDNKHEDKGIVYNGRNINGRLQKFFGYYKYGNFLKKVICKNNYDRLIVFSPQIGIFISKFLKEKYYKRYIFDYRDLSIEQYGFLRKPFLRLLDNSYANVISSPGFKKCLPDREYIISHNFIVSEVEKGLQRSATKFETSPLDILTIGGIRDFESNSEIIKQLANDPNFRLRFVGRGCAQKALQDLANELETKNVEFEGYYKKSEEPKIVMASSFLNIYYPDKISHSTALSNRFYNSLIYRRPMIVTKGQIQGDYAEKYNVGIAVEDPSQLRSQLKEWVKDLDFDKYQGNCISLLKIFIEDYNTFKNVLRNFLN